MADSSPVADQLREVLDRILATDIDANLIRAATLGDASFSANRPLFEEVMRYCERLKGLKWDALPITMVEEVRTRADQLAESIVKIGQLTLNVANPPQERDNLAQLLTAAFTAFKERTVPLVGFLSWETLDISSTQREMASTLEGAKKSVADLLDETNMQLDAQKLEANQTLEAIRTASAEAGVGGFHEQFDTAARRHEGASGKFLAASIILGLVTAGLAITLVVAWKTNGDLSEGSVVQLILAKTLLLAVGFYATTAALRMYRSQVHLGIVNRHRETSLKTFQAFARATDDPETKNKILLEVTHTIFGQVPTGLVEGNDGSGVVEVLDGVAGPLIRRG